MATERHDHRFLGLGQDRGPRFLRPGFKVLNRRALAPLRQRLGVDAQVQTPRALSPALEPMAGGPSV
jgi:hypothetical protein